MRYSCPPQVIHHDTENHDTRTMNVRDIRRHDRATRVLTFGQNNAADFAADSLARGHFAAITTKLAAIDDAKTGQTPDRVSKETLL